MLIQTKMSALLPKIITANTLVNQKEKEICDFSEFRMSMLFEELF